MDVRLAGRRNMYCWHCPMLAAGINFFPAARRYCRHGVTPELDGPMQSMSLCIPIILAQEGIIREVRSNIGPMVEIHDVSEPDRMFALFGFIGVPFHERQKIGDAVLRDLCRAQLIRLLGEEAYPHAEFLKDWAADPFTSTSRDWPYPQGILYHPPAQITARGVTVLPVSLANGPPSFTATAGAIDAAAAGVQHIIENKR